MRFNVIIIFWNLETCPYDRLKIGTEEIFVSPTAQDPFTKYDVFDESNDIDGRTSTRRPKSKFDSGLAE